ncbi:sigma-70 family RNA polymerase sigma factor [Pontivivens insulae]|uniref:ECF RNA polymerase sigma factor SigK n=1 Tax=Pontivivens insulae TaxID=1639689 RepID=A0A2R8AA84_9RHOB|nr:sigma-70 family RNA polymerase sigma factor [Pontivivens insulae]RED13042.1 RNA polymerase sigma-70 factor (ECF subfamily) [Pontivivens insulae]SPF29134.1 ECF RNA polymerase sigma factor SigK [Pontivivens insulae]
MAASDEIVEIEALIARCGLKDKAAFGTLYDRTSAKLFGTCLRVLKNSTEAEEALQDIYIKIWRNASKFRPGTYSPITWLVAVARNHCIDLLRAKKGGRSVEIDEAIMLPDPTPGPERQMLASDARQRIEGCLRTLPEDRSQAVRAAYLDGYSYAELAAHFDVPLNTMRTWLRRALLKLRDCLGDGYTAADYE